MDERFCVPDTGDEVSFLESLSSLSMDSTSHANGAMSPTSLMSETTRLRAGPSYVDTASSNMVVNDMDTSLTQLPAEESNYFMTVHA